MRGKAQSKAQLRVTAECVCGSCSWARALWPAIVNRAYHGRLCMCDQEHVTAGGVGLWAMGRVIWGAGGPQGVCLCGRCAGERWGACAWGRCTPVGSRYELGCVHSVCVSVKLCIREGGGQLGYRGSTQGPPSLALRAGAVSAPRTAPEALRAPALEPPTPRCTCSGISRARKGGLWDSPLSWPFCSSSA